MLPAAIHSHFHLFLRYFYHVFDFPKYKKHCRQALSFLTLYFCGAEH